MRQGCTFSSSLFALFIDDLEEFLSQVNTHCPCLGSTEVRVLKYCDDIAILSESQIGLQRALNKLAEYVDMWELEVNIEKTKITVFSKGSKLKKSEKWFFKGTEIEIVKMFKYLGVIFTNNGNFGNHAKYAVRKARSGLQKIRKTLYKYDLDVDILKKIFVTMIEPIVTYGSQIWCNSDELYRQMDSVIISWGKEILGLCKGVSNAGVLYELGWIATSVRARQNQLIFYHKTKTNEAKILQKKCIDFFENKPELSCWVNIVKRDYLALQMENFQNLNTVKKVVKEKCVEQYLEKLKTKICDQPSMILLWNVDFKCGGNNYLNELKRNDRKTFAKFRLGNFFWESKKRKDGTRICFLCNENEDQGHILQECQGMTDKRKSFMNVTDFINCSTENLILYLDFLKSFFARRTFYL